MNNEIVNALDRITAELKQLNTNMEYIHIQTEEENLKDR